jgi:hypothetical protein
MTRVLCIKLSGVVATFVLGACTVLGQTGPVSGPQGGSPVVGPQTGILPTAVKTMAGTQWNGSENLQNWGKLCFVFEDAQKATMIDAHSKIGGTYSQNGSNVSIQFKDCVYTGTIQGNVLAGNAQFTSGQNTGVTWTFSVQLQGSQNSGTPAANGPTTGPQTMPGGSIK